MRTNTLATAFALSDRELLAHIGALIGREREATAELVAHLAALEMRPNLYAAQGYGSLFAYCTEALHLSEDAACNRIEAARASTRFPVIVDLLASGSITLTAVRLLKRHLTPENHEAVLASAARASKEKIELLIAELAPRPDVPPSVRKLPAVKTAGPVWEMSINLPPVLDTPATSGALSTPSDSATASSAGDEPAEPSAAAIIDPLNADRGGLLIAGAPPAPAPRVSRPIVQPLAPERYRVQFTIGQDTHDRLRRVQTLLRRQIPDGDTAAIFDRALRLLEGAEMKKQGFAGKPARRLGRAGGRNYESRIRSGTDKAPNVGAPQDDRPPHKVTRGPSTPLGAPSHAGIRPTPERRLGPSRHIPTAVKRAVWWRDAGQCAFTSEAGHRCTERRFLELHHIQPYALDGPATVNNISLRCRRHNQYEGEVVFGPREYRSSAKSEHRMT
jgi:hypothetical protein